MILGNAFFGTPCTLGVCQHISGNGGVYFDIFQMVFNVSDTNITGKLVVLPWEDAEKEVPTLKVITGDVTNVKTDSWLSQ